MEATLELSHHKLVQLDKDYKEAAAVGGLRYVTDKEPGIVRTQKGTGFAYTYKGKAVESEKQLERIRKLAIPPAWTDVWICASNDGHIQATGTDQKGRKQYRYHALWHELRNETKFHKLYEFGKRLPSLRLKLEEDLAKKELCEEKVIATIVSVMERTYIRIGNDGYEKLYGSYGLTTLKDKHVTVKGGEVQFCFTGKKGVTHKISLRNKRLARIVQHCRDIPGKELFQYYDSEGNVKDIDSGMVNRYIKDATGADFSAKDFRTWAGTLHMLQAFKCQEPTDSDSTSKKAVVAALDWVSKKLGNTRTVCKKYYVHPGVIRLYEEKALDKYLKQLDKIEQPDDLAGLTGEEKVLMKLLKELL